MFCPYCKHSETKVTDTRDSESDTRRRRECLKCSKRFTTYEKTESPDIKVVKKDGSRQVFSRDKLKQGIMKALEKRPVSTDQIDKLLADIELKLESKGKEVSSKEIGELVMRGLRKLDKVAYIRFASVYRDFQDVDDFKREIKEVS